MNTRKVWYPIFLLIFLLACNVQGMPLPANQAVTSTIPPPILAAPTIQIQPTSTLETQSQASIQPAVTTATATVANTITQTPTSLAALPDFDSIVNFGGGGGDAPCLYVPDKPLPAVEGSTAFSQYFLPRTAILCIWGAPFDTPLQISMHSPSGQSTLNAEILVQSATESVMWLTPNFPSTSSLAARPGNTTAIFLSIWWPGQIEKGDWQVNVGWNGGSISGIFSAISENKPEISFVDNRSTNQLLPGSCLPVSDQSDIKFFGTNFPATGEVFVLVYSHASSGPASNLFSKHAVQADSNGSFTVEINQNFKPGVYSIVGLNDPKIKIAESNGQINYDALANAIDCISVEPASMATSISCPGAPLQRMIVNQRGYVCTKSDSVKLRINPSRSGNQIIALSPQTLFTVIGGPSCADNWSWWNISLENGTTGWISEGGDEIDPYFICPMK